MSRPVQRLRQVVLLGAVGGLVLGAVSCGVFETSDEEDDPQELVGAPPEDDDPFAYTGRSDQAERVGRTGQLNKSEPDAGQTDTGNKGPESADETPSAASAQRASPEQATDKPDGESQQQEPAPSASQSKSSSAPQFKCFSCVRICPAGETPCRTGNRDVICGWGVHENKKNARELARAECSGALERERSQGHWSEIAGECPPADCRKPN